MNFQKCTEQDEKIKRCIYSNQELDISCPVNQKQNNMSEACSKYNTRKHLDVQKCADAHRENEKQYPSSKLNTKNTFSEKKRLATILMPTLNKVLESQKVEHNLINSKYSANPSRSAKYRVSERKPRVVQPKPRRMLLPTTTTTVGVSSHPKSKSSTKNQAVFNTKPLKDVVSDRILALSRPRIRGGDDSNKRNCNNCGLRTKIPWR